MHNTKAYARVEVQLRSILISAVDGEWSASGRRSTPEERISVQTEQEAGRDPAAVLISCSKEKPLDPIGNQTSNPTATILTTLLLRYILLHYTSIYIYIIYSIYNIYFG
jgi:hypothetical protein